MVAEYLTTSTEETIELAERFAKTLRLGDNVLLYGDLGAGKTQFAKGVAKGLGIKETIKSPTFAYVNQYSINLRSQISDPKYLYHYDLYRLEASPETSMSSHLMSLGFQETIEDPSAINVVEWADRLDGKPHSYIDVAIEPYKGDKRAIKISYHRDTQLDASLIPDYYAEWQTPLHVRDHCKQVATVAMQIAEAYFKQGVIIDCHLLYTACMLHDMCRVCDFRELDRDRFDESIAKEEWDRWEKLREAYSDQHHADIAFDQLKERGYSDTAEVIRLHKSTTIVKEWDSFDTLEKKIVYYADKRVKHREIVDLKERFRDGQERYGEYDDEKQKRLYEAVEEKTHRLEKELFKDLDIAPEDIV